MFTLVTAVSVCPAWSQIVDFQVETIQGDGRKANVISINFLERYFGSQIFVELTHGSIINEPFFCFPLLNAPSSLAIDAFPQLRFDTYLAQGAVTTDAPGYEGNISVLGGAVNIVVPGPTGSIAAIFDDPSTIYIAYAPSAANTIVDRQDFTVAQIGFTDDAQGTFTYFGLTASERFISDSSDFTTGIDTVEYEIRDGAIVPVPEPASAALLIGLGLVFRHRAC
ncbi:MAG: hypothetical protein AAGH92_02555 [Planctomycetota bacterium]